VVSTGQANVSLRAEERRSPSLIRTAPGNWQHLLRPRCLVSERPPGLRPAGREGRNERGCGPPIARYADQRSTGWRDRKRVGARPGPRDCKPPTTLVGAIRSRALDGEFDPPPSPQFSARAIDRVSFRPPRSSRSIRSRWALAATGAPPASSATSSPGSALSPRSPRGYPRWSSPPSAPLRAACWGLLPRAWAQARWSGPRSHATFRIH